MNPSLFSQCQSYLVAHAVSAPFEAEKGQRRAVTISREAGAGAITVGELAMEYLENKRAGDPRYPWALFDRQLVKKVLKDHQLPESFEQYMPEDSTDKVSDLVEDMLGLHPSTFTLVQHTNRTIFRLGLAGNVILVGRGSNLVTARLKHVLHVRLVAPLEARIRHIGEYYHFDQQRAAEFVRKADKAKARYIRSNFKRREDDPTQFHLTINTGMVSFPEAARMIGDAVLNMQNESPEPEARPANLIPKRVDVAMV
ncbi:cytidylate kinase-like family protein [soil metagenome]